MNDHIRRAGQFVQEAVHESARQARSDYGDAMRQRGFTTAAGITQGRIQQKIDGFREQMKGPGLTKTEQAIYAQLNELQSEIEADYDLYWRGSGLDWRPSKPVAKGVIRQTGDSEEQDQA